MRHRQAKAHAGPHDGTAGRIPAMRAFAISLNGCFCKKASAMIGAAPGTVKTRAGRTSTRLGGMPGIAAVGEDLVHAHRPALAMFLRSGPAAA